MMQQPAELSSAVAILSETNFFRGLTPVQLDAVAELTQFHACAEAEQLYRIGQPAPAVYVLVAGTVRLSVGFGERNACAGDILRRGDLFGWAAMTPRCNLRIATAVCLTACTFLPIDGAGLVRLMDSDHSLGYRLMCRLNDLISGTLTAFAGG